MGDAEARRRQPLFPNRDNLYRWLGVEGARELSATEIPGRPARMRCAREQPKVRLVAPPRQARRAARAEEPE